MDSLRQAAARMLAEAKAQERAAELKMKAKVQRVYSAPGTTDSTQPGYLAGLRIGGQR